MDRQRNSNDVVKVSTFEFEDALIKCGIGKYNYVLIIISGFLMACAFIELTSVNLILPIATCDLKLSTSDKGILGSIGYVGVILSSFFWGFLSDVKGRKTVLIPTLLLAFLMSAISSLVNSFWLLSIFRFLNGFFIACASSTTFAYLGEFHAIQHRAKVLIVASILYSFTSWLLPTFAILIINQEWSFPIEFLGIDYKPWRLFLLACSLPCVICAIVLQFFLLESPKYTFSKGDEIETLKILRKIFQMNSGKSFLEFEVKEIKRNDEFGSTNELSSGFFRTFWNQSVPLFQGKYLRNILTACFIQFAICSCVNAFWVFLPEIINKIRLFVDEFPDESATACEIFNTYNPRNSSSDLLVCVDKLEFGTFIYIYVNIGISIILNFVMSLTINRVGKLITLELILLLTGFASVGAMLITNPTLSSYFYLTMMFSGLGMVVVNASTIELFPTKMRAMAVCVSMMIGRVGSVVGSVIIGIMIDEYCKYTFLMPITLLFSSAALAFTIPNIGKRIK